MSTLKVTKKGYKEWRNEEGQFHRIDGPARIYPDNAEIWYLNGKFHRVDGPAVVYYNGDKEYWINGKYCLNKDEWFDQLPQEQKIKMAFKLDQL